MTAKKQDSDTNKTKNGIKLKLFKYNKLDQETQIKDSFEGIHD